MKSNDKSPLQMKIFPLFTIAGWLIIVAAFIIGAFFLAPTTANYLGGHSKAVRDAAESGSVLLGQLQFIAATPIWLLPFTFVGVASFITGIALAFSTIPDLIKQRGDHLAAALPHLNEVASSARPIAYEPDRKAGNRALSPGD